MEKGNGFVMGDSSERDGGKLPKIDFSSFVLSLYSSGLVQLGKVEDPSTGRKEVNLDLARHTIEIISMLAEKTRGNLSEEEQNLLKALLSEIRMAFVEAKKA